MSPPPTNRHQSLVFALARVLADHAPQDLLVAAHSVIYGRSYRIPDVTVALRHDANTSEGLLGPALPGLENEQTFGPDDLVEVSEPFTMRFRPRDLLP